MHLAGFLLVGRGYGVLGGRFRDPEVVVEGCAGAFGGFDLGAEAEDFLIWRKLVVSSKGGVKLWMT
jgi:hypothetical protein